MACATVFTSLHEVSYKRVHNESSYQSLRQNHIPILTNLCELHKPNSINWWNRENLTLWINPCGLLKRRRLLATASFSEASLIRCFISILGAILDLRMPTNSSSWKKDQNMIARDKNILAIDHPLSAILNDIMDTYHMHLQIGFSVNKEVIKCNLHILTGVWSMRFRRSLASSPTGSLIFGVSGRYMEGDTFGLPLGELDPLAVFPLEGIRMGAVKRS